MSDKGKFVISLDFELLWGMRDKVSKEDYGENIIAVRDILPRMLDLFTEYDVKATFATVGFLFASNKQELLEYCPESKPNYKDDNLSPYNGHFNLLKESEVEDKYHYAADLIELLKEYPEQEIGSHTFSHYYCNSEGQSIDEFASDMEAAVKIANAKNIDLKSLIFPRNMVNDDYLKVCESNGINSFRGNEHVWFHKDEKTSRIKTLAKRGFRLLNAYINVAGHHCYRTEDIAKKKPYDIPASRFLRPYSKRLKILEGIRRKRILKSMTFAARNGEVYHLWWHPHNFGQNQEENFMFLNDILKHYKKLNKTFGFTSITMKDLATQMDNSYA
ncbi:MAG: polysaccharide deacetylase family protein [Flavobacteriaceae bacterium]|nr:polysaccharide deacetylase family protein [Bacteroidia bacterium]NNL61165.1 polysaccharide deacetylase family protein [Flavobacteriaceae bacterium]